MPPDHSLQDRQGRGRHSGDPFGLPEGLLHDIAAQLPPHDSFDEELAERVDALLAAGRAWHVPGEHVPLARAAESIRASTPGPDRFEMLLMAEKTRVICPPAAGLIR